LTEKKSRLQQTSGKKPNYYEALIIAITLKKFFFVKKKHAQHFFSSSLEIIVGCDIGVNVCRLQCVPLDGASKKSTG